MVRQIKNDLLLRRDKEMKKWLLICLDGMKRLKEGGWRGYSKEVAAQHSPGS
jgi:hypothetical protein